MGFFSAKSTTTDPMSLYTPEQRQAIQALMSLASTGSGGGINLGKAYGGDLGFYQQTPGELQALSGLQGLVNGQDITGARDVYSRMAGNTFNQDDPSSGYAAFSRALAKAGGESQDALNRQAAISGGVFGSGRGRDTASLQADLANQRGSFLANLFNQGENRALQGAQGLQSLVGTQQNLFQQLASQAEIERLLKDKQAKDRYTDFNRQQQENMTRIGLMQDQWQNPMAPITTKSPSGFSQLASTVLNSAGQALGSGLGTMMTGGIGNIGGMLSGLFSGGNRQGININAGGGGGVSGLLPSYAGLGSGMFL